MKFMLGHWMMKPNIRHMYANSYFSHTRKGNAMDMIVPIGPCSRRGSGLMPTLNVTLDTPMEGVIAVTITHFKGAAKRPPCFAVQTAPVTAQIEETDEYLDYISGPLTARVHKGDGKWGVDYLYDGKYLTGTGFRAMAHMTDTDTGKGYVQEALELSVGENVYGLGERFGAFVKNGQAVEIWQGDGGSNSEMAYKNIPFYLTNRGYGIFVDTPRDVAFEVGSENVERVQFSLEGESMTYFVIGGPAPKDVLKRYTALLGRPALPPAWSFGLWLSTSFTTDYDEKTVMSFIEGMETRDIPLSVFHFDSLWMRGFRLCDFVWDPELFPDPEGMLRRIKAKGLKVCVWMNPYIAQYSCLFDEGLEKGYLVKKTDGSVWQTDLWQTGMGLVDFTNPEAYAWFQGKLRALLEMGVDCFKTDFGERIPVKDIAWHDGSDPVKMHNYYTLLFNRCVFSLLEEVRGKGEAVVFARSATAGGQQMPVHWGGDNFATYVSMAETLRAGLSLACCGFGYWSHDISGFESTAPEDVYKRWLAFGLLSSHSRLHGSSSYRVPWLFGEESVTVARFFTKQKCRLMPYLYEMARLAHEEGIPMLRPMAVEFPDDPACDSLDRQYMLGDSLLVAPVFQKDGAVNYYLPEGTWTHLLDGRVRAGGRWFTETYDFLSLPLWVREGAILCLGANENKPDYDYADGVTIRVYPLREGATAVRHIPDTRGKVVATVVASRMDGKTTVSVDSAKPYTIEIMGEEK